MNKGFFIGPLYPVGLYVLIQVVPKDIHIGALGTNSHIHYPYSSHST